MLSSFLLSIDKNFMIILFIFLQIFIPKYINSDTKTTDGKQNIVINKIIDPTNKHIKAKNMQIKKLIIIYLQLSLNSFLTHYPKIFLLVLHKT